MLTRDDMAWFWEHYLDGRPVTPDAAPLLADDLAGLPPASIAVAGFDPRCTTRASRTPSGCARPGSTWSCGTGRT